MDRLLPKTEPLPYGISLRPAALSDAPSIRAIIHGEGLNPISVHWQNFLLAVDGRGKIVGIGAVKTHGDGSRELASIAVLPSSRGRGVATAIIRAMTADEAGPLYLTCRDSMAGFYERFGFRAIGMGEMTPYFQRLYRIFSLATRLLRARRRLVVMKKETPL